MFLYHRDAFHSRKRKALKEEGGRTSKRGKMDGNG
jgi:hypothetical protein